MFAPARRRTGRARKLGELARTPNGRRMTASNSGRDVTPRSSSTLDRLWYVRVLRSTEERWRSALGVAKHATASMARAAASALVVTSFWSGVAHAQFSVSSNGAPNYAHALAVPPGVAGMSPKLGLSYAGGGVSGPVGYG